MQTQGAAPMSGRRKFALTAAASFIVATVAIVAGEVAIRLIQPQRSLYPRTEYSASYGFLPYPNTKMVHEVAGRWRHVYSTNEFGHRGPAVPISNVYPRPVVVVLGDSYSFGVGVNDGEEFAAVIRERLTGRYDVANLGVEGWGLTQQIRRFYELGQLYQPRMVILQFCANDPADNLLNAVTALEDGRFVFRSSSSGLETLKRYLSRSILQKSQIYNLARQVGYSVVREREVEVQMRGAVLPANAASGALQTVDPAEARHMKLLAAFAADLDRRSIPLIMFAVDGQLNRFPALRELTMSLHGKGQLHYVEMLDWFPSGVVDTAAEGHWAPSVHRIIGEHLSAMIDADAAAGKSGQARPHAPAGTDPMAR